MRHPSVRDLVQQSTARSGESLGFYFRSASIIRRGEPSGPRRYLEPVTLNTYVPYLSRQRTGNAKTSYDGKIMRAGESLYNADISPSRDTRLWCRHLRKQIRPAGAAFSMSSPSSAGQSNYLSPQTSINVHVTIRLPPMSTRAQRNALTLNRTGHHWGSLLSAGLTRAESATLPRSSRAPCVQGTAASLFGSMDEYRDIKDLFRWVQKNVFQKQPVNGAAGLSKGIATPGVIERCGLNPHANLILRFCVIHTITTEVV